MSDTQPQVTVQQQLIAMAVADSVAKNYGTIAGTMRSAITPQLVDAFKEDGTKTRVIMHNGKKLATATLAEPKDSVVVKDEKALRAWLALNNPGALVVTVTIDPNVLSALTDPKHLKLSDEDGGEVISKKTGEAIPGLATKKAGDPKSFSITGKNAEAIAELAANFDIEGILAASQQKQLESGATVVGEVIASEVVADESPDESAA